MLAGPSSYVSCPCCALKSNWADALEGVRRRIDDTMSHKHEEQIAFKNLHFMIKKKLTNICMRENRGQHIPFMDQGPKPSWTRHIQRSSTLSWNRNSESWDGRLGEPMMRDALGRWSHVNGSSEDVCSRRLIWLRAQ